MSDNLYAPPRSELGQEARLSEGSGDFDFGRAFSDAWANTWANFPLWLLAGIVSLLSMLVATVTIIGLFLVVPILFWGAFAFVLRMHDGGARLGDLFSGFQQYGRVLGGMIGFYLLTLVISVVSQAPLMVAQATNAGAPALIAGWVINLGVTLLITPRLYMAIFLMIDRGLGLGEGLRLAWDRTSGLMWKLAGLMLIAIPILLVGAAALLIGMIPAAVVSYLMWPSAYRQIFGGAPQAAA